MEQKGFQLDSQKYACPVCQGLMNDPVTIPCGHTYCMNCIKIQWDEEGSRGVYSCPQCRTTFRPRPELAITSVLAEFLKNLKKSGLPETDPAEMMTMKMMLKASQRNIQQKIQEREKDVKLLQQEEKAISVSADEAVEDSEKLFSELIHLLQKVSSEMKQGVRSQQQTEVSRVQKLQEKLEQETAELKRKDGVLEQLSHTQDHNQFLHDYPSGSALSKSTPSSSFHDAPRRYFEDITEVVSQSRDKLQDILLREMWTEPSH